MSDIEEIEERAVELQMEYIYLKSMDWFKDNKDKDRTEWGFEK